jgi:methylthioxylose transferase
MIRRVIVTTLAWAAALVAIAWSVREGRELQREAPEIFLGAAPFVARNFRDGWDWRFGWGLVGAAAVGAALIVAMWRGWWWQWRSRVIVAFTAIASAAFAVLLALTDGTDGLRYGAEHDTEYLANVATMPPLGEFLRTFVERIDDYTVHVRGHPPGFVSVLWVMDRVGLGGVWPTVMLSVLGAAILPAAVLVAVHARGGAEWVRRCAPLLIVAPYALWMVTSGDAVFTAVGACGVAACVLGAQASTWRRAAALGLLGGLGLAALLFLTYGGATFLLVPLVPTLLAWRRRPRMTTTMVVAAAVAAAAVTAAFALAGFWWLDGARATREQYWAGTAQFRPFGYFMVANLAVAVIAIGPATYAGLLRLWHLRRTPPPIAVFVVGALLALLASHLSQYTRGEVERIWLLFYPWIVLAGSTLVHRDARLRSSIVVGAQVASAVLLQAALVSKW